MSKEINFSEYTYREFINEMTTIEKSPRAMGLGHDASNRTGDDKWYGSATYEEALKIANDGWDYGIKELALEEGIAVSGGINFTPDIQGSVVNIGAYLMGQPDCMYDVTEEREYNLEELIIVVPLHYNAVQSVEKALKYCKSIIELLNKYQTKRNVQIVSRFDSNYDRGRLITNIIVKDFDTRFVINNIAYAFHPSFLRRLYFRKIESTDLVQSGYGRPITGYEYSSKVEEEFTKFETLILPNLEDTSDGTFAEDRCLRHNFKN